MTNNAANGLNAKNTKQIQNICDEVSKTEGLQIPIVIWAPPGGLPLSPLVGRNHMKACLGKRKDDFTPAIRQFRKSMQKQDTRPVIRFSEAGFKYMHI